MTIPMSLSRILICKSGNAIYNVCHDYVLTLDQDFYFHPQAIYRIEVTRTRSNRSSITIFLEHKQIIRQTRRNRSLVA